MLEPHYCKGCGKEFYPTPMHRYRDYTGVYCGWTCFNHRKDKKKPRPTKQVELHTVNGDFVSSFASATEAAQRIGGLPDAIRDACRTGETYKGYKWNYR